MKRDAAVFNDLMQFLRDAPVFGTAAAGGRDFLLVHGGLRDFSPEKKLKDYAVHDLLWERPKLTDEYFDDITTVFGHTPTKLFDEEYDGRIYRTRTWTCIDCGAGYGNEPVLLRLDDYSVFSLSQTAVQSIRHCEKNTEIRAFND